MDLLHCGHEGCGYAVSEREGGWHHDPADLFGPESATEEADNAADEASLRLLIAVERDHHAEPCACTTPEAHDLATGAAPCWVDVAAAMDVIA